MSGDKSTLASRKMLAILLAWVLTVLDAAVPAYAVGGLGELGDTVGKKTRHATGAIRGR
ncbi:MAG: hypothetical protein AVDCRST_MAG14-581 [uncultured Rubrobacteraceae bacterium]|uniref:Uncharacterized protein n=1 Tax=uncultured Rubrobacteraceae bacterium TaxID=349277 RepID=A0A6J4QLC4_9ACTN|nr:MAG: hypothetical protein AVDCRST_MAG14-581 [uncultured Rubrobacteraceae bacterium]